MAKPASKTQSTGTGQTGAEHTGTMMPGMLPLDRLFGDGNLGLEAWTEMNKTLMDRFAAWQSEATRFVTRRLEEDLASQRELASCRSPSEALEVWTSFTRKAMEDYLSEAGKVSDIAGEMTKACAAFGESLTASAMQGAKTDGAEAPSPVSAAAKATDEARSEIAA